MTTRRQHRTRLDVVRPLGARLTFVENEWLPSMFRRVGHALGTSAEDITDWCGLYDLSPIDRARLGTRLTERAITGITNGLGCTAAHLQSTVMSSLPEELVRLRDDGTPIQSKDWSRGSGTRYCLSCLRERPGVFYTQWRLWWSFICERHHTVLRSGCPACYAEIVEATLKEREPRDPGRCWALRPDGGDYCRHDLTDAWDEPPVDENSPMLKAQLVLARRWGMHSLDIPWIPARTLRGTGIALLGAGDIDHIAELAQIPVDEIRGLFDQRDRTEPTPPREPLAMAALLGAAYRLITEPEIDVHETIRRITFTRPVRSTDVVEGPGSALFLLGFWPGIDERMRARVVRALDRDLPPIQRLVNGSAASAEASERFQVTREAHLRGPGPILDGFDAVLHAPGSIYGEWWAERSVPKLLWPSWAAPLDVAGRTEATMLQRALADALRIAGTGPRPNTAAIAGIGKRLRPSMLGTPAQTDAILRQICELALVLRAEPGPIDYERRLRLPTHELLLEEHWQTLAASVGEDAGGQRRLINARRYAFLRMSAAAPRDLPEPLRLESGSPDVSEYTHFLLTMSAELKVAIDDYLIEWLVRTEDTREYGLPRSAAGQIVVAHEPPRFRHPGARLAPELDDIDLPKLHELVGNGLVRLGHLAAAVDRTPRHVRWAIAAHPVPSGRLVAPVDWRREFTQLQRGRHARTVAVPPSDSWADNWLLDLRELDVVPTSADTAMGDTPKNPSAA